MLIIQHVIFLVLPALTTIIDLFFDAPSLNKWKEESLKIFRGISRWRILFLPYKIGPHLLDRIFHINKISFAFVFELVEI